jgi:hypothetical protein
MAMRRTGFLWIFILCLSLDFTGLGFADSTLIQPTGSVKIDLGQVAYSPLLVNGFADILSVSTAGTPPSSTTTFADLTAQSVFSLPVSIISPDGTTQHLTVMYFHVAEMELAVRAYVYSDAVDSSGNASGLPRLIASGVITLYPDILSSDNGSVVGYSQHGTFFMQGDIPWRNTTSSDLHIEISEAGLLVMSSPLAPDISVDGGVCSIPSPTATPTSTATPDNTLTSSTPSPTPTPIPTSTPSIPSPINFNNTTVPQKPSVKTNGRQRIIDMQGFSGEPTYEITFGRDNLTFAVEVSSPKLTMPTMSRGYWRVRYRVRAEQNGQIIKSSFSKDMFFRVK